jgi:hypothetical protein
MGNKEDNSHEIQFCHTVLDTVSFSLAFTAFGDGATTAHNLKLTLFLLVLFMPPSQTGQLLLQNDKLH